MWYLVELAQHQNELYIFGVLLFCYCLPNCVCTKSLNLRAVFDTAPLIVMGMITWLYD